MYGAQIASGKMIEYRSRSVLMLEGDSLSTYNLDYYRLPVKESDEDPLDGLNRPEIKPHTRRNVLLPFSRW